MKTLLITTLILINSAFAATISSSKSDRDLYINIEGNSFSGYSFELCKEGECESIGEEGKTYSVEQILNISQRLQARGALMAVEQITGSIGIIVSAYIPVGLVVGGVAGAITSSVTVGIITGLVSPAVIAVALPVAAVTLIPNANPILLNQLSKALIQVTADTQEIEVKSRKIKGMAKVLAKRFKKIN